MQQNKNANVHGKVRCEYKSSQCVVRVVTKEFVRNKYHKEYRRITHAPFRGDATGVRGITPLDGRSSRLRKRSTSRSRLVDGSVIYESKQHT